MAQTQRNNSDKTAICTRFNTMIIAIDEGLSVFCFYGLQID